MVHDDKPQTATNKITVVPQPRNDRHPIIISSLTEN